MVIFYQNYSSLSHPSCHCADYSIFIHPGNNFDINSLFYFIFSSTSWIKSLRITTRSGARPTFPTFHHSPCLPRLIVSVGTFIASIENCERGPKKSICASATGWMELTKRAGFQCWFGTSFRLSFHPARTRFPIRATPLAAGVFCIDKWAPFCGVG